MLSTIRFLGIPLLRMRIRFRSPTHTINLTLSARSTWKKQFSSDDRCSLFADVSSCSTSTAIVWGCPKWLHYCGMILETSQENLHPIPHAQELSETGSGWRYRLIVHPVLTLHYNCQFATKLWDFSLSSHWVRQCLHSPLAMENVVN